MAQTPAMEQTSDQRLAIEDTTQVEAPVAQVYQQWNDFSRYPEFMRNVISVTPAGEGRYHWVASFFGQRQEWDSEVTSREENRSITWRGVENSSNTGSLTFTPRGENATEVRLQMELTPPMGLAPERFSKLAESARKNTHQDLKRFSQQMATRQEGQESGADTPSTTTGLASQLGVALAAAGVAAYGSYIAEQRLKKSSAYRATQSPVSLPFNIASWSLIGASGASVLGAVTYRQMGKMNNALFIGQWAPTFLALGGLVRVWGHRGIQTSEAASITSWSFVGGCLGSIGASVALHTMGKRKQGLFVGQWAPTLMNAAVFARLFNRL